MHELSIASAIVERVLEFAEADPPKKILEVRLLVGELFMHRTGAVEVLLQRGHEGNRY